MKIIPLKLFFFSSFYFCYVSTPSFLDLAPQKLWNAFQGWGSIITFQFPFMQTEFYTCMEAFKSKGDYSKDFVSFPCTVKKNIKFIHKQFHCQWENFSKANRIWLFCFSEVLFLKQYLKFPSFHPYLQQIKKPCFNGLFILSLYYLYLFKPTSWKKYLSFSILCFHFSGRTIVGRSDHSPSGETASGQFCLLRFRVHHILPESITFCVLKTWEFSLSLWKYLLYDDSSVLPSHLCNHSRSYRTWALTSLSSCR